MTATPYPPRWRRAPGVLRAVIALAPLALAIGPLRHAIESRMLLHMLVEFPLLLAAGMAVRPALGRALPRLRALADAGDWRGLTGWTWLSLVPALWMLPAALDAALLDPTVGAAKLASWWVTGLLAAGSWRRLAAPLRLFLLGNLAWMFATAGLLFIATPARLCVSYLQDEQVWTGRALVMLALALGGGLVWASLHSTLSPRRGSPDDAVSLSHSQP